MARRSAENSAVKDEYYSTTQLARMFKMDRVTCAKRLESLTAKAGPRGAKLYRLSEAYPLLMPSDTETSLDEAKLRKARAEAERVELQVARLRGQLIDVESAKSALYDVFRTLYQRIVVIYPRVASTELALIKDRGSVELKLRQDLTEIFNDLRANPIQFVDQSLDEDEESEE